MELTLLDLKCILGIFFKVVLVCRYFQNDGFPTCKGEYVLLFYQTCLFASILIDLSVIGRVFMLHTSAATPEHLEQLEAVFSRLSQHNLKLKASKCKFLRSKCTYQGQVVSEQGIETDPEKTEAIKTWPVPKTVKDVRAFLGFTGY